ncbi:cystathionine beta-lyase/cystathionine gamma-synthase [Nibricoccus aquaticus]|uniref:Cystathionine beta-lyase/cystathionine gamma-synthase n=1 Tax=Nibricoccus aquaticus TaxID=2576891 RepID=A0A290Q4J5_9BACT|nr:PLP-dependent transferase [Nibricoccus aquaticus]ATC63605.1 cystathionine beta-lyase/cystathionine gamma-synthase [Nibricoccus aquaticus]
MSAFSHLPLGQRIPAGTPHAVSASLPTMRAVIGYEEKNPEITRHMTSGYPRFVKHPFLKKTAAHILHTLGLEGWQLWPTSSAHAAATLCAWLGVPEARVVENVCVSGVAFPANPDTFARAKTYLQHTGTLLSSREAEDYLVRVGELPAPHPEPTFEGYAASRVKGAVARAFQHASPEDVFLANSGMNAVYAAFRAADSLQRPRGRKLWIQLGWLYLDTIAILQKFTGQPAHDYVVQHNVFDLAALRKLFATRGHEIAGLITEVPTNPLIQTPDLAAIYELCRAHQAIFVADPTIASPLNIDILPHTDVAVNSLTKYTASEGDVLAGAIVVNPRSPWAADFRRLLPGELQPVYSRDLSRLASQIGDVDALIAQVNRTAPAVVEFLLNHPRVKNVWWSEHPDSRDNYLKIARSPASIGSMISFTVENLAEFYDRLSLPKGPSFGMKTSLICPFIYLAHYDLVTSEHGRAQLAAAGLDPELLRLSIGSEPADDIIAALAEALA